MPIADFDPDHLIEIRIISPRLNITDAVYLYSRIPDQLTTEITSSFSSPFDNDGTGWFNSLFYHLVGRQIGSGTLSSRRWESTEPFRIDIPLVFVAETDSYNDVVIPLVTLMCLGAPSFVDAEFHDDLQGAANRYIAATNRGFEFSETVNNLSSLIMRPPGPNLGTLNSKAGDRVDVRIGNFMRVKNIIVESVNSSVSGIMSVDGHPTKIEANLAFTSALPTSVELLTDIFGVPSLNPKTYNKYRKQRERDGTEIGENLRRP